MSDDGGSIGFGLHDARIEGIEIDWTGGSGSVALRAHVPRKESVRLRFEGLVEAILPRRQPWGIASHAFSVNDVRERILPDGALLELEMSSGDLLVLVAHRFWRETV